MKLESVRALKAQFNADPKSHPRAITPVVARAMLEAARPAARFEGLMLGAVLQSPDRSIALGAAPSGQGQFKLAIRVQDRGLLNSPEVDRIARVARNEVDIQYVGRLTKRARPWYRSRVPPLQIGVSVVGPVEPGFVSSGTLGGFVRRPGASALMILSNNHVLANENRAKIGDAILQPGTLDRGRDKDRVATLSRIVRLKSSRANAVDSAMASVEANIDIDPTVLRGLGRLRGMRAGIPDEGDSVAKIGRTTGLRRGRITAFEVDNVEVEYDIGKLRFDNQIEIEGKGAAAFSDSGDSGSLIVDEDFLAVAQLFAGSDDGGANGRGVTYATPINSVLSSLGVELVW